MPQSDVARPTPEQVAVVVLTKGAHSSRESGLCFLEAAAWFAGREHTDHPPCVSPTIGDFGRAFNDLFPDTPEGNARRTVLLRPLIPVIVGTADGAYLEMRRSYLALDWLVRTYLPAFLELSAALKEHAEALRSLQPVANLKSAIAAKPTLEAARVGAASARDAAWAAARAAAVDAVWDAAGEAAGAAAWDAAWAAARDAAWDAAWDAAVDAAWDAAVDAARDAAWDTAGEAAGAAAAAAAAATAGAFLAPVVARLQESAADLIRRMAELT